MSKPVRNAPVKQKRRFKFNTTDLATRTGLAAFLGKSYDGDRDLYTALGYPTNISFKAYLARFLRQDICNRVVSAYPDATWRGEPKVVDNGRDPEGEPTEFEKAWDDLVKNKHVYHYLNRVDTLSGIGRYGVLLIGTNSVQQNMSLPLETATELLYMKPLYETHAEVQEWESDPTNERYGLPKTYKLQVGVQDGQSSSVLVHYSRLIHVAEGLLEDDVYGTPRLQPVFNRMEDVARLSGGSAEMFWKGAFPGLGFTSKEDATFSEEDLETMEDEIQDYFHGLTRYLRMQGVDINQLSPQVASPEKHFELQIQLISGATGIPKRILLGSEQGELASSQDETNWLARVDERRKDHAGPMILSPFIDFLIGVGLLPEPKQGYSIEWPDIDALSEKEQAEIGKIRAEAIKSYMQGGGDAVLPVIRFLEDILGYDHEAAQEMVEDILMTIQEEEALPQSEPLPGEEEDE